MVFPNVSEVLTDFIQPVTKNVITVSTVDFERVETVVSSSIDAVVQVAQKEDLKIDQIDWSLEYIQVHSVSDFDINNEIIWQGKTYSIVSRNNYQDYGYTEGVGEEVKRV